VLMVAMTLAAPHLGNYDAILGGIAAMLVLAEGANRALRPGEAALAMAVWASTAINPPFLWTTGAFNLPLVFHLASVTPLLGFAFIFRQLLESER